MFDEKDWALFAIMLGDWEKFLSAAFSYSFSYLTQKLYQLGPYFENFGRLLLGTSKPSFCLN